MLEFWFDPKVSVAKKLIFLILLVLVTIGLYWYQPLTLDNIFNFLQVQVLFF